jgi:hypothetical protein
MTMPHVVCHYLRWFELEKRKQAFNTSNRHFPRLGRSRSSWRTMLHGLPPNGANFLTRQNGDEEPVTAKPSDPAALRNQ